MTSTPNQMKGKGADMIFNVAILPMSTIPFLRKDHRIEQTS